MPADSFRAVIDVVFPVAGQTLPRDHAQALQRAWVQVWAVLAAEQVPTLPARMQLAVRPARQARPKAAFRPAARAVPPAAAAALRSGRVKSALQIFPTARKVLPLQVSVPLQAAPQERTVLAAGESERLQRAAQQLPRQTAAALRVEL